MIVCICKNVKSTAIQNVIEEGATSLEAVREQTGATGCCGKCRFRVNRMLHTQEQAMVASMNEAMCS